MFYARYRPGSRYAACSKQTTQTSVRVREPDPSETSRIASKAPALRAGAHLRFTLVSPDRRIGMRPPWTQQLAGTPSQNLAESCLAKRAHPTAQMQAQYTATLPVPSVAPLTIRLSPTRFETHPDMRRNPFSVCASCSTKDVDGVKQFRNDGQSNIIRQAIEGRAQEDAGRDAQRSSRYATQSQSVSHQLWDTAHCTLRKQLSSLKSPPPSLPSASIVLETINRVHIGRHKHVFSPRSRTDACAV